MSGAIRVSYSVPFILNPIHSKSAVSVITLKNIHISRELKNVTNIYFVFVANFTLLIVYCGKIIYRENINFCKPQCVSQGVFGQDANPGPKKYPTGAGALTLLSTSHPNS